MARKKTKGPFLGMYEDMDFPEYKFQEYPKFVTLQDGARKIVQNQKEELLMTDQIALPGDEAIQLKDELSAKDKVLAERDAELEALRKQIADMQKPPEAKLLDSVKAK